MVGRMRMAAALLLALAACAALPSRTAANKISINWKPNTNYSDWVAQHSPFYKDDWLGTPRIACLPAPPSLRLSSQI
jgi:ABC-type nitrate/sulfonate/bicarbonate transport system substrate-binding protein